MFNNFLDFNWIMYNKLINENERVKNFNIDKKSKEYTFYNIYKNIIFTNCCKIFTGVIIFVGGGILLNLYYK